jgi:hypothetical protein
VWGALARKKLLLLFHKDLPKSIYHTKLCLLFSELQPAYSPCHDNGRRERNAILPRFFQRELLRHIN